MFCLTKNAPVKSFVLMVADPDDLRKAYRIASVNLPPKIMCLMKEDTGELMFFNNGEDPETIDRYILSLWKSFLFVPCESKFIYSQDD